MISIEDRLDILDLCARYNYYADRGMGPEFADCFTPDGVFDGPLARSEGTQQLQDFITGLFARLPGAIHFTDNHLFVVRDDYIQHRCDCSFQVPSQEDGDDSVAISLLTYDDEVVRTDDGWKFRQRICKAFAPV